VRFSSGGDLEVELVGGDLRVIRDNDVRGVRFHGDVWCENLSGTVKLEEVNGDVRLSDVEGQVVLGQVAGDLRVASARGGMTVGHVHGDAMLAGPLSRSEDYILSTDGDAQVRIARGDDVRLVARAAGRIRANLPLTPTSDGTPTYSATVGSGKVRVAVSSGGDLRIEAADGEEVHEARERKRGSGSDLFSDIGNLGERIRQQVTASLAAAGINPDTGEVNLGRGRHAREAFRGFNPHTPPNRPKPPPKSAGPLSDEQLTILKMLEEGRITPEEADALLRALGA